MSKVGFEITPGIGVGDGAPHLILGGPCVIESPEICLEIGQFMKKTCAELGLNYVFKASFDKANRTSVASFRGPGLERGLEILRQMRDELGVPVVTDVHEAGQVAAVASVVDIIQIPAFLCRQTDILVAAGESGKVVNIKKGQFLAPDQIIQAIGKVLSTGAEKVMVTERGSSFGYANLVVDMRSLVIMRELGVPVIFDATHSVQLPGGQGSCSGGQREFIPALMRAATAVGIDGVFMEVHPNPAEALCDGPNSLPLNEVAGLLRKGKAIDEMVRRS